MNTGTLLPLGASLIPGWNALSTDEQMVVLLKALVGVATNKGEFFEIIRASGYPAPNGKSWSPPILNIILASLQKKALLGEDLALSPGLAEALAVRAATAPGGHDLIAKIMAAVPRSSREIGGSSWGYNHLPVDADASLARRLQLAVLANDADEVERLCTIVEAEIGGADAPGPLTVWLGRRLPDPTWIEALDERIQDRLVAAHMAAAIDHGWIEDATIGLIDHARQHDWGARQPRIDLALLRLDVLGERFEPAKARMARRSADAWPVLSAKAGIAFLSGNTDEALPLFRLALKQYRKIRSKRNVILPGEAGVFHLLALLKADDARLHGEIETLSRSSAAGVPTRESAYEAYSGLDLLFHLATGDTDGDAAGRRIAFGSSGGGETLSAWPSPRSPWPSPTTPLPSGPGEQRRTAVRSGRRGNAGCRPASGRGPYAGVRWRPALDQPSCHARTRSRPEGLQHRSGEAGLGADFRQADRLPGG